MKRTALKRSTKPLKRTPIRKRSKSKATLDKADKVLQDYYRTFGLPCLVCGDGADVMHHFILKSHSNNLRFDKLNLIPLCNSCHYKHHRCGDSTIHGIIQSVKGELWFMELCKMELFHRPAYTKRELEEIIERYKI
jgi:hypothetical protein